MVFHRVGNNALFAIFPVQMELLPSDLVITICGPEELFVLYLVSSHFQQLLNKEEVADKLISLHVPIYYTASPPFSPVYFLHTPFGNFIHRYDILFISQRIRKYLPSITIGGWIHCTPEQIHSFIVEIKRIRPVLLAAIDGGYNNIITKAYDAITGLALGIEFCEGYPQYITKAIEYDNVGVFSLLFDPNGSITTKGVVNLIVEHTSVGITNYLIEKYCFSGEGCRSNLISNIMAPEGVFKMMLSEAIRCDNIPIKELMTGRLREVANGLVGEFGVKTTGKKVY